MKDYLHFYIGQWGTLKLATNKYLYTQYSDGGWALSGALYHEIMCFDHEFILELRPLSDISEQDKDELNIRFIGDDYMYETNARQTAYLLSKGFDVFGLKEKGLAIYKTDVK
jgi:hypothetical protein